MSEFHPEHDLPRPYPMPNLCPPIGRSPIPSRKYTHETILKTYISRRCDVCLHLNDGSQYIGRISQFDKWSVTIVDSDGSNPETFFKHAIRSFKPLS